MYTRDRVRVKERYRDRVRYNKIINFEKYQTQTTNGTSINIDISKGVKDMQTTLDTTVVQL